MNFSNTTKHLAVALAIVVLSGCAMVPEPIDVSKNTVLVSFEDVNKGVTTVGPTHSQTSVDAGQKARWGGKIVSVVNKKTVSEIEVVFFPEDRLGKPKTGMPSAGRFKAVVDGFVDPLVFEQGRLITVVGDVSSSITGVIGEQEYVYPTLNAKGYYMWKDSTDINVEMDSFAFSPFSYRMGFRNSFFNPWYDPWLRNYQRSRIRVIRHNGHSQGGAVRQNTSSNSSATTTRRSSSSASPRARIETRTPPLKER
jgi:outer membrane lipoprotein